MMRTSTIAEQIAQVREQGFVILRQWADRAHCAQWLNAAREALARHEQPIEYEADLGYPGAPSSRVAEGGLTVRRLLDAYGRGDPWAALATHPDIAHWMRQYFNETPCLSLAHHNCIMTKHPAYGTLTGWHRDFRYWSFERADLVSAWIALDEEVEENGALHLIPRSHHLSLDNARFDQKKFFREDLPDNQAVIQQAIVPGLQAGDLLLFHCNVLHAASQNRRAEIKFSPVFTYHAQSNLPLPDSRSARAGSVPLFP